MTVQDRIDTGFAPWSLMTPDPAKARATHTHVQTAHRVHEDKRAPEMASDDGYMFGDDGVTFGDLLDIVNPLQHLPVVGAVYRSITGDDLDPGAKMAGGAIYGGPLGFASAMINSAIEEHTGDDVMGHMLAMVGLGDDEAGDSLPGNNALAEEGILDAADVQTAGLGAEQAFAPLAGTIPQAGGTGQALQLDPAQAAFLQRLAAGTNAPDSRAAAPGAIQMEQDGETLDTVLAGNAAAAAAAKQTGKRTDFGGVTRISDEMAQHLAMLAQSGAPNQALPAKPEPLRPAARQPVAANTAEMRAASAKYSAALPLSISGQAPEGNPFAAIEAKANQPDPFETAMNRLGLNPPTVTTRGGEDTQGELMKAAFGSGQSQTANMAEAAGITAPSGQDAIPSAMMDALQRYQAMKQQG